MNNSLEYTTNLSFLSPNPHVCFHTDAVKSNCYEIKTYSIIITMFRNIAGILKVFINVLHFLLMIDV